MKIFIPYGDKTWFSKHLAYTLQDVFKFFVFFMQKIFFGFLIFFLLFPKAFAFTDIENSFHKAAIQELENQKLVSGYEDSSFKPRNTITREEMLKLIFQLSGREIDETQR